MSFTTIQNLLDAHLLSVIDGVSVQLENTRFEPKTGVPYIRPTFMPDETERLSNESDLLQGLYTVDIFYPQDKGTTDASAMADSVKNAYPRASQLIDGDTIVHITGSYRDMAQTFQQFYHIPVLVKWECPLPKV